MTRQLILLVGSLATFLIFMSTIYVASGAAVMSVDLGSEWMKVGVVSPGVPMEIALNKESKRKTPAAVAFRDGIRSFGEDAQNIGIKSPTSSYSYLLDLLGKTIDNPIVELYKKRFPHHELIGDPERNTVVFKNGEQLYSVEELIAQLLTSAKHDAEATTGQQITECVLTVPGYFGQAERTALVASANLANLKVLQLINDYAAVALNFGVFRRSEFNESAQYYIFYDMGATKTTAALVSFQLVKDKLARETNPVIQVLGVGYDRTLGGLEIQLRLRDYLATEFNKMKNVKNDVFKNPRAMAKLFKEANRLKNVLSANADHYAQVENVMDDIDFKFQVTREKLEEISSDLWPRVVRPLRQALEVSGLSLSVVNQVILFGGGTRVPKVQEILKDEIKSELGKSLNADEAATMGAVYKAADLATGFKVKKIILRDAVIFPIQVTFDREISEGNTKQVKRMLFGLMNSYPQKKVITFNKHVNDFEFYANYAELNHLSPEEISYIGSLNISRVELKNIADVLEKNKGDKVESKGIKAHFVLDDSGIFGMTGVEFIFEKPQVETADDESTLSKLGSTISKLFSSEDEKKKDETGEPTTTDAPQTADDGKSKQPESEQKSNTTTETKEKEEKTATEKPLRTETVQDTKNETVKIVTIKEPIQYNIYEMYTKPLSSDNFNESYKKIQEINLAEFERIKRESAFNALESFVNDAQEKLSQDEYASCAVEEEKKKLLDECTAVSEWLYDGGESADAETLEKRLSELQKIANVIYARHWEHQERPDALKALDGMLESAGKFLKSAKNLTKDANPDKDILTQVEIDTLQKVIDETKEWKKKETEAQNSLKRNEEVRLTVKYISEKMDTLDREVKYLINKIKIWKPKKPIKKAKTDNQNETESNVNSEAESSSQTESPEEKPVLEQIPEIDQSSDQQQQQESTTEKERDSQTATPHGEL